MAARSSVSATWRVAAMMNKVAMAVEGDTNYRGIIRAQAAEPEATAADAISAATRQVAETLDLAAIVTYTSSGSTAIRAARERPSKPILALSPNHRTVRRLAVVWGVHCVESPDAVDLEDMVDRACTLAHKEGMARPGDRIAITAGIPLGTPGATNFPVLIRRSASSPTNREVVRKSSMLIRSARPAARLSSKMGCPAEF